MNFINHNLLSFFALLATGITMSGNSTTAKAMVGPKKQHEP